MVAGTLSVTVVIVVGLARVAVFADVLAGGKVRPSVATLSTSDGGGVGDLRGGEQHGNGCCHLYNVVCVVRGRAALFFVAGMLGLVIPGEVVGVFRGSASGYYFGVDKGISDEVRKGIFILFHVVV